MPIRGNAKTRALYRGKGTVRPIPRDQWTDDYRERARGVSQTRLKTAPQFGKGPNVQAAQISGRRIRGAVGGNSFNPAQSNAKAI